MELEPEQERLLLDLIEEGLSVDRSERRWLLSRSFGGDVLLGPVERRSVNGDDFVLLQRTGYLINSAGRMWSLAPKAHAFYKRHMSDEPAQRTERTARNLIDAGRFRERYPDAYATWSEAERLLFDVDADQQLTVVGHKAREATQLFASRLVDLHQPESVDTDPTKVERRVGVVIAMHRDALGERRRHALEALGDLWRATNGLIQRQEHAALKEGEIVTRDDARRLVLLTLVLMVELDQALPVEPA